MKLSQRQNVLRHLLDRPLCGTTHNAQLGQRLAARVLELRNAGFPIEKRECRQHGHETRQIEYYLVPTRHETPVNWCAYCGPVGSLIFTGPGGRHNGAYRFDVKCDNCDRGDMR